MSSGPGVMRSSNAVRLWGGGIVLLQLRQRESIGLGLFLQRFPAAGLAAMACAHVDLQKLQIFISPGRTQLCRPFRRFTIGYARVGRSEERRVGNGGVRSCNSRCAPD